MRVTNLATCWPRAAGMERCAFGASRRSPPGRGTRCSRWTNSGVHRPVVTAQMRSSSPEPSYVAPSCPPPPEGGAGRGRILPSPGTCCWQGASTGQCECTTPTLGTACMSGRATPGGCGRPGGLPVAAGPPRQARTDHCAFGRLRMRPPTARTAPDVFAAAGRRPDLVKKWVAALGVILFFGRGILPSCFRIRPPCLSASSPVLWRKGSKPGRRKSRRSSSRTHP